MAKKKKSHAHKEHHAQHRKKTPVGKYVFGVVVFVVLVLVVAGLIWLASKAGESRMERQSKVAAVVNGEQITTEELDKRYSQVPAEYQLYITKTILLNQTINEVLLMQEAEKQGIKVTKADVEKEISDALAASGMTDADLDARLAAQNLTKEYVIELYTTQLTINKLLEDTVFANIEISESEVEEFYDSRIRAAHILVDTEVEAEDIIEELKRSSLEDIEEDFMSLAEEKSTDPSAATNRGDLGEFGKGQMVQEFEDAAFALDEYSFTAEPIQTQFGYHVILRLPKEETLDDQYSAIEEYLLTQKKSQATPLFVNQLRSKANVQVLYTESAESE